MAKPMYVTLEVLIPEDTTGDEAKLIKGVGEEYKGKTFSELLQKMVDGSPDEYNETGYNAREKEFANHVNNLLGIANTNPGDVQLYAISKDEPPQDINVGLNDTVSDYNDRIIKIKTISGEGGEEKRFQHLELVISDNDGLGLCDKIIKAGYVKSVNIKEIYQQMR